MASQPSLSVVGIDVSKATLAVCYQVQEQLQHLEVSNTKTGSAHLLRACGSDGWFVFEAMGTYHLALAYYLHEHGARVSILNPLVIRRFIQMHLSKGKTDRKDAQWLLRYGQQQALVAWQPQEQVLVECRQLEQASELLLQHKHAVSNALEALQQQPLICPSALQHLRDTLQELTHQVHALETELLTLLEQRFGEPMALLCSIPGLGRKTAGMLLLFASGFTWVSNYRQLIAMAGLSPHEHSSGTSIRGRVRITKMGGSLIRSKLFMCSLSAAKRNAACKALYERLVAKGKNRKLALIAVCNKLLKQAFAIVQSGVAYQADFGQKTTSPA